MNDVAHTMNLARSHVDAAHAITELLTVSRTSATERHLYEILAAADGLVVIATRTDGRNRVAVDRRRRKPTEPVQRGYSLGHWAVDEVWDESVDHTAYSLALPPMPQPSTRPPIWAVDPTRGHRPRRIGNQPTRQGRK